MKNQRKSVSRNEMTKENWKRRIILEKSYTDTCAQWMAQRLEALIDYMQYGHAAIAYHKQNGEFQLVKATLVYYEAEFKRIYDMERVQSTVVYWNVEQQAWRTFQVENFLEWRPIV